MSYDLRDMTGGKQNLEQVEYRARRLAIIVAGGQGLRMGSELPKQFIPVGGLPILMHTLRRFHTCDEVLLVLPEAQQTYWRELCLQYEFTLPHHTVVGGNTRYHSVLSGLKYLQCLGLEEGDLVAIHDGVRPFVSEELIEECFVRAKQEGAALPYLPMVDSLRQYEQGGQSRAVARNAYIRVQTPQTFILERLIEAYELGYREDFTDDASVWEASGAYTPALVRSNDENIKITTPLDLSLAECLLRK